MANVCHAIVVACQGEDLAEGEEDAERGHEDAPAPQAAEPLVTRLGVESSPEEQGLEDPVNGRQADSEAEGQPLVPRPSPVLGVREEGDDHEGGDQDAEEQDRKPRPLLRRVLLLLLVHGLREERAEGSRRVREELDPHVAEELQGEPRQERREPGAAEGTESHHQPVEQEQGGRGPREVDDADDGLVGDDGAEDADDAGEEVAADGIDLPGRRLGLLELPVEEPHRLGDRLKDDAEADGDPRPGEERNPAGCTLRDPEGGGDAAGPEARDDRQRPPVRDDVRLDDRQSRLDGRSQSSEEPHDDRGQDDGEGLGLEAEGRHHAEHDRREDRRQDSHADAANHVADLLCTSTLGRDELRFFRLEAHGLDAALRDLVGRELVEALLESIHLRAELPNGSVPTLEGGTELGELARQATDLGVEVLGELVPVRELLADGDDGPVLLVDGRVGLPELTLQRLDFTLQMGDAARSGRGIEVIHERCLRDAGELNRLRKWKFDDTYQLSRNTGSGHQLGAGPTSRETFARR